MSTIINSADNNAIAASFLLMDKRILFIAKAGLDERYSVAEI